MKSLLYMTKFVRGKGNHQKLQGKEKIRYENPSGYCVILKKISKWRTIKLT